MSVILHEYQGELVGRCLETICTQSVFDNLEVIYLHSAGSDAGWDTAQEYARRYPGIITLKRVSRPGRDSEDPYWRTKDPKDLFHGKRLACGEYYVILTHDDAFHAEHVKDCIRAIEAQPLARFAKVMRRGIPSDNWPTMSGNARVNVLIHNYNYGRYLRQCLDSVYEQTLPCSQIIFSDNASTDDSWRIADEYARQHPGTITLIRNRQNFGAASNMQNCYIDLDGDYYCVLCSDDALRPTFVERCVTALEAHPAAAFAMTHRTIIDEHGAATEEPPFYNQSCLIPGAEQAAVYMMASVNPSISQIMYARRRYETLIVHSLVSRWFAQRVLDFALCCRYSMVYLTEPLLLNRVHSQSDSAHMASNLVEVCGQFILPHVLAEIADGEGRHMAKASGRLPQAVEKVARIALRYCVRLLASGNEEAAQRHFHLALAVAPSVREDPSFAKIEEYFSADRSERPQILAALRSIDGLATRRVSYDPPPGSTLL